MGLTEVGKADFVYRAVVNGPGVAEVCLLRAGGIVVTESRKQVWCCRLKLCKWLRVEGVIEIVVAAEVLPVVNPVVNSHCKLILVGTFVGN